MDEETLIDRIAIGIRIRNESEKRKIKESEEVGSEIYRSNTDLIMEEAIAAAARYIAK